MKAEGGTAQSKVVSGKVREDAALEGSYSAVAK
jgi:hypothetical protein